jgi:hypothetical protein
LETVYQRLRDAINESHGYRILGPDDILEEGDETAWGSSLLGQAHDGWHTVTADDFGDAIGKPVSWSNSPSSRDIDCAERMFRRKR